MKYAHYNETTGELLGWYDSEIHDIIPEPNIEVSEEEWQKAIDNNYNYIDVNTKTLGYKDFRSLEELKTDKLFEIKLKFKEAIGAGFTCSNGIKMDADITDISKLKAGIDLTAAMGATTMDVRDYENKVHKLPIDEVNKMLIELGENYQKLLKKKWDLENQVNNATTIEELNKINWM